MTRRRKPARAVSPTIRQLIQVIDDSGLSYHQVCSNAGVYVHMLSDWKMGRIAPNLLSVEALLQSLGYRLEIVPLKPEVDEAVTITYVIDGT